MIAQLSASEIESLLATELVARIGCHQDGHTYVVPVTYAYDGESLISHSGEGRKIDMMRHNPSVCVEVDHVDGLGSWRSVIAFGTFTELRGPEADDALRKLHSRLQPLMTTPSDVPTHGIDPHAAAINLKPAVLYKIKLQVKTGRYETPGTSEMPPSS